MKHTNFEPFDTDVLIVGAGPTGLTLAASLAQKGIRYLLVDAQAEGANTSRAAVIHAKTLEVLRPLGITDSLLAKGKAVSRFTIRDRNRVPWFCERVIGGGVIERAAYQRSWMLRLMSKRSGPPRSTGWAFATTGLQAPLGQEPATFFRRAQCWTHSAAVSPTPAK